MTIPDCIKCGSKRVKHFGQWGHDGEPESAWFECFSCEHKWTDFKLSEALLGIDPMPPPEHGPIVPSPVIDPEVMAEYRRSVDQFEGRREVPR